ncbi:MAG: chemotaxis response regulator protein-glutamate methylesterase [Rhodobacteraceae bacterium]|nr:chemotaxis response regulator protein-glutamate methylesterase [Paracoccaceae bacterium]
MSVHNRKIRTVVVDDSVLIRTLLRAALEAEGDIEVAGSAGEPYEARDVIKKVNPDVVTLDVEMPGMNGLEFLEKIMRLRPMPVVMVSSLTSNGAEATLTALEYGAVDFMPKPAGASLPKDFADAIRRKVRAASKATVRRMSDAPRPSTSNLRSVAGAGLIAIGASTGGVGAIGSLVARLPHEMPPIAATIHMPPGYTERFAGRLAKQTGHDVREARDGELLQRGAIRIAPGNMHLEVVQSGGGFATRLSDGAAVSGHKPSVDVSFRSVAQAAGKRALGLIMTGMGRDGAAGLLEMRNAGAVCLGEAASSCVVYGMPRAAKEAGAVNEEHDLELLPARLCELVSSAKR